MKVKRFHYHTAVYPEPAFVSLVGIKNSAAGIKIFGTFALYKLEVGFAFYFWRYVQDANSMRY